MPTALAARHQKDSVMGNVLTEKCTLKCAAMQGAPAQHGGTVAKTAASRLRVEGAKVLTGPNVKGAQINLCGDTNTNQGQVPCKVVKSVTGTATKLLVDGQPVVLDGVGGVTDGTPPGTIAATGGISSRLKAV